MQNLQHPGMVHELVAEKEPIVLVTLHPEGEGSQAANREEGIVRRNAAAEQDSRLSNPIDELSGARDHPEQKVGMP